MREEEAKKTHRIWNVFLLIFVVFLSLASNAVAEMHGWVDGFWVLGGYGLLRPFPFGFLTGGWNGQYDCSNPGALDASGWTMPDARHEM